MPGMSRRSLSEDGWCGSRELITPGDPILRSDLHVLSNRRGFWTNLPST